LGDFHTPESTDHEHIAQTQNTAKDLLQQLIFPPYFHSVYALLRDVRRARSGADAVSVCAHFAREFRDNGYNVDIEDYLSRYTQTQTNAKHTHTHANARAGGGTLAVPSPGSRGNSNHTGQNHSSNSHPESGQNGQIPQHHLSPEALSLCMYVFNRVLNNPNDIYITPNSCTDKNKSPPQESDTTHRQNKTAAVKKDNNQNSGTGQTKDTMASSSAAHLSQTHKQIKAESLSLTLDTNYGTEDAGTQDKATGKNDGVDGEATGKSDGVDGVATSANGSHKPISATDPGKSGQNNDRDPQNDHGADIIVTPSKSQTQTPDERTPAQSTGKVRIRAGNISATATVTQTEALLSLFPLLHKSLPKDLSLFIPSTLAVLAFDPETFIIQGGLAPTNLSDWFNCVGVDAFLQDLLPAVIPLVKHRNQHVARRCVYMYVWCVYVCGCGCVCGYPTGQTQEPACCEKVRVCMCGVCMCGCGCVCGVIPLVKNRNQHVARRCVGVCVCVCVCARM
jgi:hypothetical protein